LRCWSADETWDSGAAPAATTPANIIITVNSVFIFYL
jgi:hypothetical protein